MIIGKKRRGTVRPLLILPPPLDIFRVASLEVCFGKLTLMAFVLLCLSAINSGAASKHSGFVEVGVDRVWSGTTVRFGGLVHEGYAYVAYYDAERWLTVAKVNVEVVDSPVEKVRLPTRFGGWDAHNSTVLTVDAEGIIHISGNLHGGGLVYARGLKPWSLAGLDELRQMTGRSEEQSVTYPTFLHLADGRLAFIFRSGRSGDGGWYANVWESPGVWQPLFKGALFGNTWFAQSTSAYPSNFKRDADGIWHVALVWRMNPDVSTNQRLSYARSRDLIKWTTSSGKALSVPLSPTNIDVVDDIKMGQGLLNNVVVGIDAQNRPLISYSRYDARGHNQGYLARPNDGDWQRAVVTDWQGKWKIEGKGTLPGNIGFDSAVQRETCCILFYATQWRAGRQAIKLDARSFEVIQREQRPDIVPSSFRELRTFGLSKGVSRIFPLSDRWGNESAFSLRWESLRSNADQPHACAEAVMSSCIPQASELTVLVPR
ncbi:hypothetical protein LPJGGPFB_04334 [Ensifer adhaerens]|uniref:BNR repeat-containing protein n=1 Tax=Ensifer adhaerens TaxID=106592 RepID=UPI001569495A|nr:BNR repeat-containing protein [Ensifer adhaerens]NRP21075.1 hypothetical protein [Ensifer adhaerens]